MSLKVFRAAPGAGAGARVPAASGPDSGRRRRARVPASSRAAALTPATLQSSNKKRRTYFYSRSFVRTVCAPTSFLRRVRFGYCHL